ncbi:hypothetical protein LguiB_027015 [Lonicera macranthoides]
MADTMDTPSLNESLTIIRAVLDDAKARQVQDKATKLWMTRVKGVVDEPKIALNEFPHKILQ